MNILSSKPDQNKSSSLAPKAFPLSNLSAFSVSSNFTHSLQSRPVFPLYEELKFMNTELSMPDLFQYNDRTKLVLSSDQQDSYVQKYQQKQNIKQLAQKAKNKVASINCSKQDVKIDTQKKSNLVDKSFGNLQEKQSMIQKQQSVKSKSSEFKEKIQKVKSIHQNEKQSIEKVQIPQINYQKQLNAKKSTQIKIQSNTSSILIAPFHSVQKQKTQVEVIKVKEQASSLKIKAFDQIHQEYIQEEIPGAMKHANLTISNIDISRIEKDIGTNTDHILERIESQKNPILKQSTVYYVENKNKQLLNSSYNESVTPSRRKRNKIFEQSSKKKEYAIKVINEREKTPQKGVQTENSNKKTLKKQQNTKNTDLSPQIKALNILDKLVNQIGNQKMVNKFQEGDLQSNEQNEINLFKQLNQFNREFLDSVIMLQNLNNIEEMTKNPFIQLYQSLKIKIQRWREKISELQHIVFYQEENICKFNKLYDIFIGIEEVYNKYLQTSLRLNSIQNKLQDYVIIVRNQDSKRLYTLRNELKIEIGTLNQLQNCFGKSKLQKMFSAYLNHQLSLLSQITHIIDLNFQNQFPRLTF